MMHSGFNSGWFCGPGGFFAGFPLGGLFHFALWALLLYFLFRITRTLLSGRSSYHGGNTDISSSLTILEQRYASGEIDQEEFLRKKKDLGGR